ncbi:MAG: C_GCAxxG_C_C family protein [Muribaculaceae bacterium]|nr:C_GCAxxG_C_C family protein [Muribaculaceae bacterium]
MKNCVQDIHTCVDVEERGERGRNNFLTGLNCAQSVVAAFADLFPDADLDTAMRMAASFGGGMGRLRLTCGAVSGLAMLAGLECGAATGDLDARARNYALVQQLAAEFKAENDSLICAELLGLRSGQIDPPRPSKRTTDYYRSRPCPVLIACACRIYARHRLSINSAEASTDTKAIQSPT